MAVTAHGETTMCKVFYLETPDKIQSVACENGNCEVMFEVNKVQYIVNDEDKLVEYRYSIQNGFIVTVKTIID